MMKKKLFASLLLVTSLMGAQNLENALLWKISGNGIKEASYLYGTNHIVCNPVLSESTLNAISASKQLYTEVVESHEHKNDVTKQLPRLMMKDGVTLKSLCTPEEFILLNAETQRVLGVPAVLLNKIAPTYVGFMLDFTNKCEVSGVEAVVTKTALDKSIPGYGLENADVLESLFAILDKVDYKVQMGYLINRVKTGSTDKTGQMYTEQNINAMANEIYNDTTAFGKEIAAVLLVGRNNDWLPIIEDEIKKLPTFIAVGAAHLGGKDGLILLLRNKGYTVEAIK